MPALGKARLQQLILDGVIDADMRNVQPASVDLTLSMDFVLFPITNEVLDPRENLEEYGMFIRNHEGITIQPHQFILGVTREWVNLPYNLVGRIEGKSSLGRLGLPVHLTAGYIDPGFVGAITLEIVNFFPRPWKLIPGMPICQLSLFDCDNVPGDTYMGNYTDARFNHKPQTSRYHRAFNKPQFSHLRGTS